MDSFECSFSLVEEVIAQMNFISDERRSAFSSRLKHFQRLKYPVGINTGRGVAAIYRARHLLLMALAVEFIQLGLTPERTVRTLHKNARTVAQAFSDELLAEAQEAKGYKFTGYRQTFLGFDPEGLQDMARPPRNLAEPQDMASYSFIYGDSGTLKNWLEAPNPDQGIRVAIVPLTRFMARLTREVHTAVGQDKFQDFMLDLANWAAEELSD